MKLPCWRPAEQFEVANDSLAHVPISVATGGPTAGSSHYVRIAAALSGRDNNLRGSAACSARHGNRRLGNGRRGSPQAHGS